MKNLILKRSLLFVGVLSIIIISACSNNETGPDNGEVICTITQPQSDTLGIGKTVSIVVEADYTKGIIAETRFFIDGVGKGSSSEFPYKYDWDTADEEIGWHTIKAEAKANDGATGTDEKKVFLVGNVTRAYAGNDTIITGSYTSLTLSANKPSFDYETGHWEVVSGEGGSFADASDANTVFSGKLNTWYILRWTISNKYYSSSDDVRILFDITKAYAGNDTIITGSFTSLTLSANKPNSENETGSWEVVSGEGGSFADANDANTVFSGELNTWYLLKWTISNKYYSSSDDVRILFDITKAYAGNDTIIDDGSTSLTLSANEPNSENETGSWEVVSGEGGSFADAGDANTVFSGKINTWYTLKWTISNKYYSSSDEVKILFNKIEYGTVTDIDGNTYKTAKIGDQWWMTENLKVTHYRNGDAIPNVTDNTEWAGLSTGAWCAYNNDDGNIATYGLLYNWYAAVDSRNIAPEGWHVPTDEEWKELEMYLGMSQSDADNTGRRGTDEGSKLKATSGWYNNGNGTNESGFTALPGGSRHYDGTFIGVGREADYWSATQRYSGSAWRRALNYGNSDVYRLNYTERYGFSVRLLRD